MHIIARHALKMLCLLFFRIHTDDGRPSLSASLTSTSPSVAARAPLSVCIALDSLVSSIAAENLNAKLSSPLSYDSENSSLCSDGLAAVSPTAGGSSGPPPSAVFRGDGDTDEGGASGGGRRACRDDRILAGLGIPFTAATIINCSMEEFNSILVNSGLREEQVNTCRDMRRRGKNKIAAQNCRKRKVDQITTLAEELESVRDRKDRLLEKRASLRGEEAAWAQRLHRLRRVEACMLATLSSRRGRSMSGPFLELTQGRQLVS